MLVQNIMDSLSDIRILLGLVPKESHCSTLDCVMMMDQILGFNFSFTVPEANCHVSFMSGLRGIHTMSVACPLHWQGIVQVREHSMLEHLLLQDRCCLETSLGQLVEQTMCEAFSNKHCDCQWAAIAQSV